MQRYFLENHIDANGLASIQGEDRKHIVQVMRMTEGERLIIVSEGIATYAIIEDISTEAVTVKKVGEPLPSNEMPLDVTIVCGLAKGDKHELIVQKATELGVKEVVLFKADRSIVKWDDKKGFKKVERLEKIAKLAAEQCHRTVVPKIHAAQTIKQILALASEYDVCFIADEEDAKSDKPHRIAQALKNLHHGQKVLAVFGPEGGLSREEAQIFLEAGFSSIALGPRILRTETAPLYFLSALSYEFE